MAKTVCCIVTMPLVESGRTPLTNLLSFLSPLFDEIHVVGGISGDNADFENVTSHRIGAMPMGSATQRMVSNAKLQFNVLAILLKNRKIFDHMVFFIGFEGFPIPILFSRICNIPTASVVAGSVKSVSRINGSEFARVIGIFHQICLSLSNCIVFYCRGMVEPEEIHRHGPRIMIASRHFCDERVFFPGGKPSTRENRICFIGRIEREKNIEVLVDAMTHLKSNGVRLSIVGAGSEIGDIVSRISSRGLSDSVELLGWMSKMDLSKVLRESRIMVFPSVTEGLPNSVIESMACGTPVLCRRVGCLSEIIVDGNNGFFIEDDDPLVLSRQILDILNLDSLDCVSDRCTQYVRETFSWENQMKKWAIIMGMSVSNDKKNIDGCEIGNQR